MTLWGLIQLNCRVIRYVTPIYSPTTCLSNKLWSLTTLSLDYSNYIYKDNHLTSSSYIVLVNPYDNYITPF